jgi:hypothetical protein
MKTRSNKVFEFQQDWCIAVWRTKESSRLTGNAPGIAQELFNAISNIRHLHEMVLIEATNVVLVEMICNRDESLTVELGWLPGMDEVT